MEPWQSYASPPVIVSPGRGQSDNVMLSSDGAQCVGYYDGAYRGPTGDVVTPDYWRPLPPGPGRVAEPPTIEDAERAMRAEYYTAVRDMANDAVKAVQKGEIETREDLDTWVHETCDGSEWVIYTYRAQRVAMFSDNADAYFEEYGGNCDNGISWSEMAYCAIKRDVWECLEASDDIDVHEDDLGAADRQGDAFDVATEGIDDLTLGPQ